MMTHWQRDVKPLLDNMDERHNVKNPDKITRDKEIRRKSQDGVSLTKLAMEFDLSKSRIGQIIKEKF
jgi:hypothetical protein